MSSQNLFIGRTEELARLRKDVFFVEPGTKGYCYSLIGLNGIGKTTLIRQLSEEFFNHQPDNTFYFSTTLEDGTDFWNYWTHLIQSFSEEIDEEYISSLVENPNWGQRNAIKKIKNIYQLVRSDGQNMETDTYRSRLITGLNGLFRFYTLLGIRVILTIDEFDRARFIFKNGQFFQRLFDLSPKALTPLNLSIITISRRRISTIAHHMQDGSDLEAAFPPLTLKGFNDEELDAYFDTYEQLPCGKLPEEAKKQILYLCGRSPELLMGLRHEMEFIRQPAPDIGRIYSERGQIIKVEYNRMITLMNSSYADLSNTKTMMEVFIQKFIGPVYDDNFEEEQQLLYDLGFVTMGTAANNIFSLAGVCLPSCDAADGKRVVFEPIAPYFVEYIKYIVRSNDLSNLSGLLIRTEKQVREIIEKEMLRAFPDSWQDVVNRYAAKKDYYLDSLKLKALQNDFPSSGISKLNVISFKEYYFIMKDHWDIFGKYFSSYPSSHDLFADMSFLSSSRNDSAHLNLNVYNESSRRKLKEICNLLISCLEHEPTATAPQSGTESMTADGSSSGIAIPSDHQIEQLVTEEAIVTFCCTEIKMAKGNLRGVIKEYGYPAGVSQKSLDAFCFTVSPQVGDEFSAVIERWDKNAGIFNLKAPVSTSF